MKKFEITHSSIEGVWDWREICINTSEGWECLCKKAEREHLWQFCEGGAMISTEGIRTRYVTEYRFVPGKLRLSFEGWKLNKDGIAECLVCETYRVEFLSICEIYLYDLEDVGPGEAERFRLLFHRI